MWVIANDALVDLSNGNEITIYKESNGCTLQMKNATAGISKQLTPLITEREALTIIQGLCVELKAISLKSLTNEGSPKRSLDSYTEDVINDLTNIITNGE